MKQWSMRIGAYAERLLQGLNTIDWPGSLKEMQRNWIGKSIGAKVFFKIEGYDAQIEVFTTRPDTVFGVTFMTLAPELDLVGEITKLEQKKAVNTYVLETQQRTQRERMADIKNISGVFTGAYALHPLTNDKIPIWIGDYVLAGMEQEQLWLFHVVINGIGILLKHFSIPIKNIFLDIQSNSIGNLNLDFRLIDNSYKEASKKAIDALEAQSHGLGKTNYRLRDAVFSRQRYWGEPFPVYYKNGLPHTIAVEHLPIELPKIEKYLPTETGSPPLGNAKNWAWNVIEKKVVSNKLIDNSIIFPLELNTMPGWAGSSWYFLRYMDLDSDIDFVGKKAVSYWQDIDLYLGGSEHATGHLLYSRFWQKFLFDIGHLNVDEYAKKLINQGMILGTSAYMYRKPGTQTYVSKDLIKSSDVLEPIRVDVNFVNASNELDVAKVIQWQPQFSQAQFELSNGVYKVGREVEKMSKSKYNVVNPDDICINMELIH